MSTFNNILLSIKCIDSVSRDLLIMFLMSTKLNSYIYPFYGLVNHIIILSEIYTLTHSQFFYCT